MFERREYAVIDIGSNTVRLVIYRLRNNGMFFPIINEKVFAQLGYRLSETGYLSDLSQQKALNALKRFNRILLKRKTCLLSVFATAAIRQSKNGKAFAKQINQEVNLKVQILSGEEEAKLAMLGVLALFPAAEGLVLDLGGSSLEIAEINPSQNKIAISLPLGPLSIKADQNQSDLQVFDKLICQFIDPVFNEYRSSSDDKLYLVGGAWRALAKLDMGIGEYPLKILNGYALDKQALYRLREFIDKTPEKIAMFNINKKRIPYTSWTLQVLLNCMEKSGINQAIISIYGIREGIFFSKKNKILDRKLKALLSSNALSDSVNPHILNCLDVLFSNECFLGEAQNRFLPIILPYCEDKERLYFDKKAELFYQNILYASDQISKKIDSHQERVFIALTVFYRYNGKSFPEESSVLSKQALKQAKSLGSAIRFLMTLSAGCFELLDDFLFTKHPTELRLTAQFEYMLSERSVKQFETLCKLMELEPIIEIKSN